ncbi:MAG TPA: hypothetical protein VG452_08540 [Egibacteraceae bacterium]|nr:hypothetical protein [Actinomycetota bacterium]HWB72253.1 hypothetical protein [Egibacteraceae bacterium]
MPLDPVEARAQDLRRWRDQFHDATPIAELRSRHTGTCVGVVRKIRLVPGRTLEVMVEDGTGRLTATWTGRSSLPGVELGGGLRLTGTVAEMADGNRRVLNPDWMPVAEPYH